MRDPLPFRALGGLLVAVAAASAGCDGEKFDFRPPWSAPSARDANAARTAVPEPIHLLLPQAVRIHPFTGTRTFDDSGGVKGIDVRIEAIDAYGDSTKAFGKFQFALHEYRPGRPDPKGRRIATWEEDVLEPKKNLIHWDNITRAYKFKLQWYRPIPVGSRFILVVSFSSPFTERRFAERSFISGQ